MTSMGVEAQGIQPEAQARFMFTPKDTISSTSPSVINNSNSYHYSGSRSFAQEKVWFDQNH